MNIYTWLLCFATCLRNSCYILLSYFATSEARAVTTWKFAIKHLKQATDGALDANTQQHPGPKHSRIARAQEGINSNGH